MDDKIRLEVLDGGEEALVVGDVALAIGGGRVAVLLAAQVDGGDEGGGPGLKGLVHNVVAEEAIAANDDDAAQVAP